MRRTKFFNPSSTFALARRPKVSLLSVGREKTKILIIDGIYKNPEAVREIFLSSPAPVWKLAPGSRNFKDYYDCRHAFTMYFGYTEVPAYIAQQVKDHFGARVMYPDMALSNIFQLIRPQPKGHSAFPHSDVTENDRNTQPVNALIYLNKPAECRGGTALFQHLASGRETMSLNRIERLAFKKKYASEPIETGTTYWCQIEKYWQRFHLIEMKFNRLAIFPSQVFHGAWHEPGWFKTYPRLNQVFFPIQG